MLRQSTENACLGSLPWYSGTVILSAHADVPHPRSMKHRIVGSALADAFRGGFDIWPGFPLNVPENASAKADPTRGRFSWIAGAA